MVLTMTKSRGIKTPAGKPMLWLLEMSHYNGDDCPAWPYAKKKKGYGSIWHQGRTRVASRVLCEVVHGPAPSAQHEAAHSCGNGDKGCMNPSHLRWATPLENQADRVKDGTHNRGDARRAGTKLTVAQVVMARKEVGQGRSPYVVAERLGVKPATIYSLVKRQTWAWVH